MIDLHIHTTYSDGDKTVVEILKMCEEKKLGYISLTDHDTCKQYNDKALKDNNIFSGKIIKGTELHAVFQKKNIEILAYDIDTDVINNWCEKYYSEDKLKEQQKILFKRLLDIADKHGIIYNIDKIQKPKNAFEYVEPLIYNEFLEHKENYHILGEFAESFNIFFRKGLANPKSSYFMNHIEFRPQYKEVINIIHKAGGKAFLAHPFEYKIEDTITLIEKLRKDTNLDGIECFHPSSEEKSKRDILITYAKENNLFISGGSDYHGKIKPNIDIGIGKGNLNISSDIIKQWV